MKKNLIFVLTLAFALIYASGCKKEETCDLHVADYSPAEMIITFSASGEGDGSITSLIYTVNKTSTTVNNPSLPWSIQQSVSEGDYVSISSIGKVKKGSLKISFDGEADPSNLMHESDYCSQNY